MISLSDFGTVSLRCLARSGNHEPSHRGDHIGGLETGVLLSASPEFFCPSARSLLSAYREYLLSALTGLCRAFRPVSWVGLNRSDRP